MKIYTLTNKELNELEKEYRKTAIYKRILRIHALNLMVLISVFIDMFFTISEMEVKFLNTSPESMLIIAAICVIGYILVEIFQTKNFIEYVKVKKGK